MNDIAEDLFARALELPEAERAAFLEQACGGDAELRLEVQRLLVDAERADSLLGGEDSLERQVAARLVAAAADADLDRTVPLEAATVIEEQRGEQEGEQIGPYTLRQRLGEGGFGVVWMAEQKEPISRMVALKVVKAGMDTRQVLARFAAERQALAMMDHPNIAHVIDAGATESGRPYFAMELVKGIPITTFCDERGLNMRERLELFGDVCSAINHAHQKGVIHRDIKPSNVMITMHGDKPVVKVIDFGIAKATQGKLTDQTLFTRFEQFIGTPVYMSPEQASLSGLDIDTRSDIYSLGVLLYELLTGKPPFDGKTLASAGYEEMRRIIREVEPPKPSSRLSTAIGEERTHLAKVRQVEPERLRRLVEPDLDWIVMKAIEKDRTRRYETANAFAEDIRNFLADDPISARPPSKGYQLRKFARRHRAAFRAATLIALLLVAATGVSIWQAVRATSAERRTSETLAVVADERDAKEQARKEEEDISNFFIEVFQSPGPTRDGRETKVVELLDKATHRLELELADHPGRRARLQGTLGGTYAALGVARQAIPLQEEARKYYLATLGPEDLETLEATTELASSYALAGRTDEALRMREDVFALSLKVNGPEHPQTLKAMARLASSKSSVDRRKEAILMQEELLPLSRKVNGPEHPESISAMTNLGRFYFHDGRENEALKIFEDVLKLRRELSGPEHPYTLVAMNNLAGAYHFAGRMDEALRLQEEILPLSRKVNGPEHPETVSAMGNRVIVLLTIGRAEEAVTLAAEVLELSRKVNGARHSDTLQAISNLADGYRSVGRFEEAIERGEEALTLSRELNDPEHLDTLVAMTNLAVSYQAAGRWDDALKLQEETLALSRQVLDPGHSHTLQASANLAGSYQAAGRWDEAIKLLEEVLTDFRKVMGPEHPNTIKVMIDLARSYQRVDRIKEAIELQEVALPLARRVLPPGHPSLPAALKNLAELYRTSGRDREAETLQTELDALPGKQD